MTSRVLHLVRATRNRFQAAHLSVDLPPRPIVDDAGKQRGYLDHIGYSSGQILVQGWVEGAQQVSLRFGRMTPKTKPDLYRSDVEEQANISPRVGFEIALPVQLDALKQNVAPGLIFEQRDDSNPAIPPIPLEFNNIARHERRVDLAFWRRAIGLTPAAVGWLLTRNDRFKRKIISDLSLDAFSAEQQQFLNSDVFARPAAPKALACRVTIILPVYNAFSLLPAVIDRVLSHTDLPFHLIVINDASSDAEVWPWLAARLAHHEQTPNRTVTLLQNAQNLGFVATVNRGFDIALSGETARPESVSEGPVILLNSDAFVPKGWASRLVAPMMDAEDVATATPMSNDAEIFSTPRICARTDLFSGDVDLVDAVAARLNAQIDDIEVPTGVGFCMALSRGWLKKVGRFDLGFGHGYGEEVDWCQRAKREGARHLAVRNLFVEHSGGSSFGSAEKLAMVAKNNAIISQRYPTYDAEVQDFIRQDPMTTERLALGFALASRRAIAQGGILPVYLAHSWGGGAEIYLEQRIASDLETLGVSAVLRVGTPARWKVELHTTEGVTQASTQDTDVLKQLLNCADRYHLIYSCGVGDPDPVSLPDVLIDLRRKEDQLSVLVHDYFMISPSYTLISSEKCFAGTPQAEQDTTDPFHRSSRPDGTPVSLKDWQNSWGRLIDEADTVIVFSNDSAMHVAQVYPKAAPKIHVVPHRLPQSPRLVKNSSLPDRRPEFRIGVLGGINIAKGALVLQELAARIGAGEFKAELTVIGEVTPEVELDPSSKIHGRYSPQSISDLAEHYALTHWLIPSVWPETFSFTTREALATGLPVLTFDLGAQAEAAAAAPNGHVIPYPKLGTADIQATKAMVDNLVDFMQSAKK